MCTDDHSIGDECELYRRVHPFQVVDDENTGAKRPSSAAFSDPELSVDLKRTLEVNGLDWRFCLKVHAQHSLVTFPAGAARAAKQQLVLDPLDDNPAHTLVVGKKTQSVRNALVKASVWVHLSNAA